MLDNCVVCVRVFCGFVSFFSFGHFTFAVVRFALSLMLLQLLLHKNAADRSDDDVDGNDEHLLLCAAADAAQVVDSTHGRSLTNTHKYYCCVYIVELQFVVRNCECISVKS